MHLTRWLKPALTLVAVAAVATAGYVTRDAWLSLLRPARATANHTSDEDAAPSSNEKVIVTDQAQKNLGLTSAQLRAVTIWKTIQVPGAVVDRPGCSDRALPAPVTGVVAKILHHPGDAVRTGELLFVIRPTSEPLYQTQADLVKTLQDVKAAQQVRKRLAASGGTEPKSRLDEADNLITRLQLAVKAQRRELAARGLTPEQIDEAADGKFVTQISISVPPAPDHAGHLTASTERGGKVTQGPAYEVQDLKVELGQQVKAGQTLCLLANHRDLAVEGRAFPDETPLLQRSVSNGWPVAVDFHEGATDWPSLEQPFRIRHLSNTIDPVSRTFAFLVPIENQSRLVEDGDRSQMLWRFRPGQRVRLRVRVEEIRNVFVLPPAAVVSEGGESFVFAQNVNSFERRAVRVVLRERERVAIDNDGSLDTYAKGNDTWTISAVAQTAAAHLNRMAKGGSGAVPKGYHMHADGSLHKNGEPD